jgi:hypothetical protein
MHASLNFFLMIIIFKYNSAFVGFYVCKMVIMKSTTFWDEMPCNLVKVKQHFSFFMVHASCWCGLLNVHDTCALRPLFSAVVTRTHTGAHCVREHVGYSYAFFADVL